MAKSYQSASCGVTQEGHASSAVSQQSVSKAEKGYVRWRSGLLAEKAWHGAGGWPEGGGTIRRNFYNAEKHAHGEIVEKRENIKSLAEREEKAAYLIATFWRRGMPG